jgi:hypothetical protein
VGKDLFRHGRKRPSLVVTQTRPRHGSRPITDASIVDRAVHVPPLERFRWRLCSRPKRPGMPCPPVWQAPRSSRERPAETTCSTIGPSHWLQFDQDSTSTATETSLRIVPKPSDQLARSESKLLRIRGGRTNFSASCVRGGSGEPRRRRQGDPGTDGPRRPSSPT